MSRPCRPGTSTRVARCQSSAWNASLADSVSRRAGSTPSSKSFRSIEKSSAGRSSVEARKAIREPSGLIAYRSTMPVWGISAVSTIGANANGWAVLSEIATGATNAIIAERLVITETVVEKHCTAIFAKLGLAVDEVNRRVSAVLVYLAGQGA